MVALVQSPVLALEVGILYIIIQQFENHLIYPLVVRKIVGVPSIMVILALVIGAQIGGFFGLLFGDTLGGGGHRSFGRYQLPQKQAIKES